MEDLSGKTLGKYQIVGALGQGGMAAVYKAFQPGMDRYVALKILPRQYASDPEFIGRFDQEAKVIAKLQHPHILPVHDFGQADAYTYLVMPLVETGTLADLLKGRPLPLQRIRTIISQIGDALDYAHSQGLIHRDVKPSNILIDRRGNCLLTDFGIAKMVEGTKHFTATGGILGTPHYMSPEQGTGEKLTLTSDIYSLGVVLYQMATGQVPFDAETPLAVVIKHMNDPLPLPSKVWPGISRPLETVILTALAKAPEDRFSTAADMVQAVRTAIPETAAEAVEREVVTVPHKELAAAEEVARQGLAEPQLEQPPVLPEQREAPKPGPLHRVGPWVVAGGLALLGLCGLGTFVVLRLFGSPPTASNLPGTRTAVAIVEQTAISDRHTATSQAAVVRAATEAVGIVRATATAEAQSALVGTSTAESATTDDNQPLQASLSELPAAHWPLVLSEPFDSNINGWNPFTDFSDEYGTRSFTFSSGKFRWELMADRDVNLHDIPDTNALSDFYAAVELRQASGPDTADYGLAFRLISGNEFYAFTISDTQQYAWQMLNGGEWTTLIPWTETETIVPGGDNRIAVLAEGEHFMFFINDQLVDEGDNADLKQGRAGLVVDAFDPGITTTFEFDNFELRQPWMAAVVEPFEVDTGLFHTGPSTTRDLSESLAITGGKYRWTVDCENSDVGCISSTDLETLEDTTDFQVSVEARRVDGPLDAQYGLRFRVDGQSYFEFLIADTGAFWILRWDGRELEYYYLDRPSPAIHRGDVNRLTVFA
ncbi:MAG: serine/threonine-protein kinase, partial [Chloroflexota bacterium]